MNGAAASAPPARKPRSNLQIRILSAIVLAIVVFGATWLGGIAFRIFAVAMGLAIFREWLGMTLRREDVVLRRVGWLFMLAAAGVILSGAPAAPAGWMFGSVAMATLLGGAAGLAARRGIALGSGIAYAGLPMASLALLRGVDLPGMIAIAFLLATVWATDIFAYFAGRRVGGPKLAPRISPNKTWSGAIGGAVAAVVAGAAIFALVGHPAPAWIALGLAMLLSVVAQAGDLLESAVKRHFGVKDSGGMIPGHGGVMDRFDGLVTAAVVLYMVGAVVGSADVPSVGLFSAIGQ